MSLLYRKMRQKETGMPSLLDFLGASPFAVPPGMDANPDEIARFAQGRGITGLAQGLLAASGPSRMPVSMGQAMGQGLLGFQQGQEQASGEMYKAGLLGLSAQKQRQEKAAADAEAARQAQLAEWAKNLPSPMLQQLAAMHPEMVSEQMAKAYFNPPVEKPLTEAAQLRADLDAGRIDQATYDALIKKATHIAPTEGAGGSGGPFAGNALDAQDSNILIKGDPGSPEYAMAYQRQFLTPRWTMTEQGMVPIMPTPPQGIRPPTGTVAQAAAPTTGLPEETLQPASGAPKSTIAPSQPGYTVGAALPGTAKPPTEGQLTSAGFADRMVNAEKNIQEVMKAGYNPTNLRDAAAGRAGMAGKFLTSTMGQRYSQAQRDWVTANLRKESGAAIPESEMDQEIKKYFPSPGETDPAVIAQYERSREIARQSMIRASGNAYKAPESKKRKYNPETGTFE
jgi:hypothetical protein